MQTNYLSRLPSTNSNITADITECFNPFQADLINLQRADTNLHQMNHFCVKGQWLPRLSKSDEYNLQNLAPKLNQDANGIVWIRLDDYKYPRMALYVPEKYRNVTLC